MSVFGGLTMRAEILQMAMQVLRWSSGGIEVRLGGKGADAVIVWRSVISGRFDFSPACVFIAMRLARISIGQGKPHPPICEGQRMRLASVLSAEGDVGGERPIDLIAMEAISLRMS